MYINSINKLIINKMVQQTNLGGDKPEESGCVVGAVATLARLIL